MIPPPRRALLPALLVAAALLPAACASAPGKAPVEGVLDARRERVTTFEAMVEDLASVRMVFVGESHTNPEHHALQGRILEALAARRPCLLVGMEMFERPYQPVLDRWSAGTLAEDVFLREANWYGQWSRWDLYGPILRLARDRGIRVVALNAERSVIRSINRSGLDGLPPWERVKVPSFIDTSIKPHEKTIREVFGSHPGMEDAADRFRRFYEAQCTWDETMAESTARALDADGRPDAAIVVLAGALHVKGFHAIPERARRRNGLDYRVVLPMERESFPEEGIPLGPGRPADYVIFTGPSQDPGGPRLGVSLRGGDSVVKEVAEGTAAAEAGLKAGDRLDGLDGVPVADEVDLKVALDGRIPGDRVRVRWTRDGAAMEGTGTLTAPPPFAPPPKAKPAEGGGKPPEKAPSK